MKSLTNDVTGMLVCGKLIDDNPRQLAHDVVVRVRNECAQVVQSMYIACDCDQQELIDSIQQQIVEQIIGKIGND